MFRDLKVLELASVLAGPAVGQFFAELGAEVIKVENILMGGDVSRTWKSAGEKTDDRSAYFCSVNWGKKSIAIDLTTYQGRKTVQKLAAQSDIVIASYKPGDAAKLGVSYEQLKAINPALIYGFITGYGEDNERVGLDAVLQAESGFMSLNGDKNGLPLKMPVALIDILAAHQLKEGLLIALMERMQTGSGRKVSVSLMQTAISSLANQASNWLVGKYLPSRNGSLHPNIAPYGEVFRTRDGEYLILAIGNDRQFQSFAAVLGIPALAEEKRFTSNHNRVIHREILAELLLEKISTRDSSELMDAINREKIPAGLVLSLDDVLTGEQAQPLLLHSEDFMGLRTFIASSGSETATLLPPPHLGQHTEEIIRKLAD